MGGLDTLISLIDRLVTAFPVNSIPWVIATSLLIAGSMKLRAPAEAGQAAKHLGLRVSISNDDLGRTVALGELAIALFSLAALLFTPLALAPLTFFVALFVLVSLALHKGLNFECSCFGGSAKLSWLTLLRLAALSLLVAVFLLIGGPLSVGNLATEAAIGIAMPALIWIFSLTRQAWFATRPLIYERAEEL